MFRRKRTRVFRRKNTHGDNVQVVFHDDEVERDSVRVYGPHLNKERSTESPAAQWLSFHDDAVVRALLQQWHLTPTRDRQGITERVVEFTESFDSFKFTGGNDKLKTMRY